MDRNFPNQTLAELAYQSRFGVVESYVANVDENLSTALRWAMARPAAAIEESWPDGIQTPRSDYRILTTFGVALKSCADELFANIARSRDDLDAPEIRILLLDPYCRLAKLREDSLLHKSRGVRDVESGLALGLTYIALALARNPALKVGAPVLEMDPLISFIQEHGPKVNVDLRFYRTLPSGISYFFKDLLIKGFTPVHQLSDMSVWDVIVNHLDREDDRYDHFSEEFEWLWDEESHQKPGGQPDADVNVEPATDLNVFVSHRYPRSNTKDVRDGEFRRVRGLHSHIDNWMSKHMVSDGSGGRPKPEVFLDLEDRSSEPYDDTLKEKLKRAAVLVLVFQPGQDVMSETQAMEFGYCWGRRKPIIPLIVGESPRKVSNELVNHYTGVWWNGEEAHNSLTMLDDRLKNLFCGE